MERILRIEGVYYLVPVKNGAPKITVRWPASANSASPGYFTFEAGSWDAYDFIACGVSPAPAGSEVTVEYSGDCAVDFHFTNAYPAAPDRYAGVGRPQWHFSSRRGWLNDPNGLFFLEGRWHLFYQHNPYGINWGNMHWGHAVSADLLHWEEWGDVLAPDDFGTMFSGSAVVDEANVSGLGDGSRPPVLLFYTAAGETCCQCLAYSRDGGRTFAKYPGNPVLPAFEDARDPNLFQDPVSGDWILALYLGDRSRKTYQLYRSGDLLHWRESGRELLLPGERECPGCFALPVAGEAGAVKFIFWGANGRYWIGDFDGVSFVPESGPFALFNRSGEGCAYAGQSWSHAPGGRRIFIAWLTWGEAVGGGCFSQSMTVPVELTLQRRAEGLRLAAAPVRELARLRGREWRFERLEVRNGMPRELLELKTDDCGWEIEFELETATPLIASVCGIDVAFEPEQRKLRIAADELELPADAGKMFRILTDRGSVELFAAGGRIWFAKHLELSSGRPLAFADQCCGCGVLRNLRLRELRSVWQAESGGVGCPLHNRETGRRRK